MCCEWFFDNYIEDSFGRNKLCKRLTIFFLISILIIGITALILTLEFHPHRPHFILQDVDVKQFNVSNTNTISSSLQVTIISRNPNDKVGFYYDQLDIYVAYRGQMITLPSSIPKMYQGHQDVTVWSPFIYGVSQPIAPFLAVNWMQDLAAGRIFLEIKIDGRMRQKFGVLHVTSQFHFNVNCPAQLSLSYDRSVNFPNQKFSLGNGCHASY